MQLTTSAMAVAMKAVATYGIPPLIIPDPLIRPSGCNSSSSKQPQNIIQVTPIASAQGMPLWNCLVEFQFGWVLNKQHYIYIDQIFYMENIFQLPWTHLPLHYVMAQKNWLQTNLRQLQVMEKNESCVQFAEQSSCAEFIVATMKQCIAFKLQLLVSFVLRYFTYIDAC